jgi:formate hydrogenlyase transcriptional activator
MIPELVYSLNFLAVSVPPLFRRKEDAVAYLNFLATRWEPAFSEIDEAKDLILTQISEPTWTGDYVSLAYDFKRACIDLEPESIYSEPQFELFGEAGLPGPLTYNEYNRSFLKTVLKFTKGKIYGDDGAAKLLGLKPTTLQSKLKKLGIR